MEKHLLENMENAIFQMIKNETAFILGLRAKNLSEHILVRFFAMYAVV